MTAAGEEREVKIHGLSDTCMYRADFKHSLSKVEKEMEIEPFVYAYRSVRKKKHGIGEGSRLRALKLALCMFSVANGTTRHWYARLAHWLAFYGTPPLPPIKPKS